MFTEGLYTKGLYDPRLFTEGLAGLRTSQGGGAPTFDPSQINSLAAWYKSSTASTISQVDGRVSEWRNKKGSIYNLTQSSQSNQFITNSKTLNNKNVLDGNGKKWMTTGVSRMGNMGLFADLNEKWTVLILAKVISDGTLIGRAESSDKQFHLFYYQGDLTVSLRGNDTNLASNITGSFLPLLIEWNGADPYAHIQGNNMKLSRGGAEEQKRQNIIIGARENGSGYVGNNEYAEIMFFDDILSTTEKDQLNQYINNEWGVSW